MKTFIIKSIEFIEGYLPLYLRKGRLIHFVLCLLISLLGKDFAVFALGFGFGKELGDYLYKDSGFDIGDMLADVAGVSLGLALHYLIFLLL